MERLKVLLCTANDNWSEVIARVEKEPGNVLVVLGDLAFTLLNDRKQLAEFLDALVPLSSKVRLAARQRSLALAGRSRGLRVIDKLTDLRLLLEDHPQADETIRRFSPHLWQQKLRSNLQTMGLLSLPKLRIWILIVVSIGLLYFVMFRLLPSAEIIITPREDTVSQTVNIFLVQSGSLAEVPDRVRTLELTPINVTATQTITFDQVSKDFVGTNAQVALEIINNSAEDYLLRGNTRVMNQAGMVFRLQEMVSIPASGSLITQAIADDLDIYGDIVGERGNVAADLKWYFPGLLPEEQEEVYAVNIEPGVGGTSEYRNILQEEDLFAARVQLEEHLLATAKQMVEEQMTLKNSQAKIDQFDVLYYDELTRVEYSGFDLARQFIGKEANSIPLTGTISYTVYTYNSQAVLDMLKEELFSHTEEGKRLLESSVTMDRLTTHVTNYNDDLSWIKLTPDLSGTEQFILDPLSPTGALFAKQVRELIIGKEHDVARRILQNLPEVEQVSIKIWPPWNNKLPTIPSHITTTIAN